MRASRTAACLAARCDCETSAIVPDIISILDAETATSVTNETLRYAQRVRVLAVGVPGILSTEAVLRKFGPVAFQLDEPYIRVTNADTAKI